MIGSKYRVGERIGAGGMAEVFRADLEGTQGFARPVAIKRVLPARAANPHHVAMFVHEAHIMAALRHPNVVAANDFTRDAEGRLLLVMELADGVDLRTLVRAGPVPVAVAVYIITELLHGLGHVHACRDAAGKPLELVHHDLSPSNVLLSWDGAVKLADFGLAKAYAGQDGGDSDAYGTPGYMSPEQVKGGALDRRSDLFTVGVLLYELLTGTRPFVGTERMELDLAIVCQRIAPPRALQPDIPADLDALVMQLLEREPAQRPASAEAARAALERCEAASPRGRTDLIALLRARFPASGAPEASKQAQQRARTERAAARNEEPPPVWLVGPGADAAAAPERPALPEPEAVPQAWNEAGPLIEKAPTVQAPPPPSRPAAPAEQASAAATLRPAAQPPDLPKPHSRPVAATTRVGMRWARAAALVLVLGSVTGWLLLREGRDAPQRLRHTGGPATEERRSEDSQCLLDAPASPAPARGASARPARTRPAGPQAPAAGEIGPARVAGSPAVVEMF